MTRTNNPFADSLLDMMSGTATGRCAWRGLSFMAFTEKLQVTLTPGQRAAALVCFDGYEPQDLDGQERELSKTMFGGVDVIPPLARGVIVAVCGGRGGKSYVLVALRLLWGALVRSMDSLAPGQRAMAPVVAPNDGLRQEVINYIYGACWSHPDLQQRVWIAKGVKPTADAPAEFAIRRGAMFNVRFVGSVATAGGYGGRGRSLTDAALDEAAFFRDASAKINDSDIYSAMSPRVMPGGQTIIASTPWAKRGLLWDMYQRNFGHPVDAICIHAPTMILNGSKMTADIVSRERARDPDNAAREFDAMFSDTGSSVFFGHDIVELATKGQWMVPQPGDMLAAGADLGMRRNSSVLAVVCRRGETYGLVSLIEKKPMPGHALKPGEVCREFADECNRLGVKYVMSDGHYLDALQEALDESGLSVVNAPSAVSAPYMRMRTLMREGQVSLPDIDRLKRQMQAVEGVTLAAGGMSIRNPQWSTGEHGDLVSALVLAMHQVYAEPIARPGPAEGSEGWEAALFEERRKKIIEQQEKKPYWKR
jgi:hypothetical protein